MIQDIPTEADFTSAGKDFLCLAWDNACGLSLRLQDSVDNYLVEDAEASDMYWRASQRYLSTALSLIEQAVEFIIKGRIAAISPYLLIANDFSSWPKPSNNTPVDFASFKTIDAKDLLVVHNAICSTPLPESFTQLFEKLRKQRNTIMHTVDPAVRIHASDLLETILEVHYSLFPDESWIRLRRESIENGPESIAYFFPDEYNDSIIIREILHVIEFLTPEIVRKYFNFDKKQRRYICPDCHSSCSDAFPDKFPPTAVLHPKGPQSTLLFCFICTATHTVTRKDCTTPSCKGNVLYDHDNTCLTCYNENDIS